MDIKNAQSSNDVNCSQGEMSGSISKVNLNDIKAEQAKIKFIENANNIINDPLLAKKGLKYLIDHPTEYKEIFGHDLKLEDTPTPKIDNPYDQK